MTFHIVEVFSEDLSSSCTVTIGWHTGKDRLAVWFDGVDDSFGFTWFDRLIEKGFTIGMPMNFERECLFCGDEVSESEVSGCQKLMMFYDHEVNEQTVEEAGLNDIDMSVNYDGRVWSVNTPRLRYEDIVTQYVCEQCGDDVLDNLKEIAKEIPEEIVLRSV